MPRGAQIGIPPENAFNRARKALSDGDFLEAYDIAMSARAMIDGAAGDRQLAYCATLALARMDDTHMALELYESAGLGESDDDDLLALRGRLMKDLAEKAPDDRKSALFAKASDAYRAVYEHSGGYFPAINAATTAFLAGDEASATALAEEVLVDETIQQPVDYYSAATAAEALLLVGRGDEALEAMASAVAWPDATVGPRASTFRQMMLIGKTIADRAEMVAPMLELLRPAPVLVYTGHMFREDSGIEAQIREKIDGVLDDLQPDALYGAAACGADILIAEAALARGIELHLVFPFAIGDFVEQSVKPGGESWFARFESVVERATRSSMATDMGFIGDPGMFGYGSKVAMGLARMRAEHLRTDAIQLAVVQQDQGAGAAGTASDVLAWNKLGLQTVQVDPGPIDRALDRPAPVAMTEGVARVEHSMIFADFAGFSQLTESALPVFARDILGRIGAVLDGSADQVLYRNSWGDALYAVIDTPIHAAELVLQLQAELDEIPEILRECADQCGMRIGVHHGPIYRGFDAVIGRDSFYGTEVTRTARIEPVTPTGEVYATEAFAGILSLEQDHSFATHYVGKVQLAKGYGQLAMYKLSRLDAA